MIEILNELRNTKGVTGIFVANMQGNVAASSGELEAIPLKSMAKEIKNLLSDNKLAGKDSERIQFTYDNTIIIIQLLEIGFVVVICEPNAVTALLRLALNVAYSKIKNNNNILQNITNA